ncbi:MAG TPA: hypothetical protein VHV55_25005, partial [Pirellulales bacterium]|nr:hypothetical protein [Pirellulales bacterium]
MLGLLLAGPPMQALAAIYTWDGTTSSWSTSTNWTPNGLPGAGDTALFGSLGLSSVQLGGNQAIGNLTFLSGGSVFALDAPGTTNTLTLGDTGTIWDQSGNALGQQTINDLL